MIGRQLMFVTTLLAPAWMQASTPPASAPATLGYFEKHEDVGQPTIAGSASYDARTQAYELSAAGTNMWAARDEFHFAWRKMTGDFIVRADVELIGTGVDPHRKLGWIIRKSLDADSPYADAAVHGDGLTSLQFRRTAGAATEQKQSALTHATVVQLERRGETIAMSVAKSGEPFVRTELEDLDLGDEVYVGLFLCSHNPKVTERAIFRNVRIVVPPKTGWVPYRDYIGSNLEVMTVDTGARTVLDTSPISLQAPNWTPDGKTLIYNSRGHLYRFDLATSNTTAIDSGEATNNNNDHVLSWGGRMLGISSGHNPADNRRSVVYTMPVDGGAPKRITANSPSYLHTWSPDNKWLLFTGQRNGELDIYRIAAEGGDETRLTDAKGVDDGPEYTPDGQWVYFNSTRTGKMQIWRMKPDGSGQEQITSDDYNNWFPHISPDGRRIVFVSYYTADVQPEDHPFYRHVYIRLMDLDGKNQKIVAYVFGGQGTMNVPSWSPDGKRIAFVSNSALPVPLGKEPLK